VTHESAVLFVDPAQTDNIVRNHLGADVEVQPYDSFFQYLKKLGDNLDLKDDAVRL
jgi:Xaa-Pro aminopeptidase